MGYSLSALWWRRIRGLWKPENALVIDESSDKMWPTGKGNDKPLQYSCLENPINTMKRQEDRTLKHELPRPVGAQYVTEISGEITPERMKRWSQSKNNTQLWMWLVMDKVWCYKEQYCIGTWNVRSMNQGKLEVVKQEMAKSEHWHFRNQWTKMDWNGWI